MTALAAAAVFGCGKTPVAPDLEYAASTAPPIVTIGDDGTAGFAPAPSGESHDINLASGPSGGRSLETRTSINGALGGTATCGRFSVVFPPGAFLDTRTVQMKMADTTKAVVDLGISGSNSFLVPVALRYDPSGLNLTDVLTIYWYDSSRKRWVDLHADVTTGLPTAYLTHFSAYSSGKAGW